MVERLPKALDQLVSIRNDEHIPLGTLSLESVGVYYKKFLGIGMEGVLPRLARTSAASCGVGGAEGARFSVRPQPAAMRLLMPGDQA